MSNRAPCEKPVHVNSGRHCFQIKAGRHFCSDFQSLASFLLRFLGVLEGSQRFCRISKDFSRIFTKSKLLGVLLHPLRARLPYQCIGQQLSPDGLPDASENSSSSLSLRLLLVGVDGGGGVLDTSRGSEPRDGARSCNNVIIARL